MKNKLFRTISTAALATLIMAAFAHISVSAQETANEKNNGERVQEDLYGRHGNARKLEGSWNHQGMRLSCATGAVLGTFQAMFTFHRGGTLLESGSQISPALRGPGHGIWNYESGRRYITAFQFFRFNPDGTLAGRQLVRQQIEISSGGDTYAATATAQVLDVAGNVIQNNCAAGSGVRFE